MFLDKHQLHSGATAQSSNFKDALKESNSSKVLSFQKTVPAWNVLTLTHYLLRFPTERLTVNSHLRKQ